MSTDKPSAIRPCLTAAWKGFIGAFKMAARLEPIVLAILIVSAIEFLRWIFRL